MLLCWFELVLQLPSRGGWFTHIWAASVSLRATAPFSGGDGGRARDQLRLEGPADAAQSGGVAADDVRRHAYGGRRGGGESSQQVLAGVWAAGAGGEMGPGGENFDYAGAPSMKPRKFVVSEEHLRPLESRSGRKRRTSPLADFAKKGKEET